MESRKSKSRAKPARKARSGGKEPKLLSGGNPQIAKGDGDGPVQAYIAAMPGWKRDVGRRLDALIAQTVPEVRKAVRWNSPFYGIVGQGWFLGIHCISKYVKVAFFRGTLLRPPPPVASKQETVRYLHIHEDEQVDEGLVASWIRQASKLPGESCFPHVGPAAAESSGAPPRERGHEDRALHADTIRYEERQSPADRAICRLLATQIDLNLPEAENRIWHGHPVWFLVGNPIVGYGKLKDCIRLLFWSGQSFEEEGLEREGSFKAAEARYRSVDQVDTARLRRWLTEAREIQWDYKNLMRRKGRLRRLK